MPLKSDRLIERLRLNEANPDASEALGVVPCPDLDEIAKEKGGTAAIDLRLGRWLLTLRQSRATLLEVKEANQDRPAMPSLAERFLEELRAIEAVAQAQERKRRRAALDKLLEGVNLDRLRHEFEIYQLNRDAENPARLSKYHFVPFGDSFILHPGDFVLGITFEWLKFPSDLAGFVTGKSKWGRRGLIIETAAGIHPGFCGCLTLEIGNVGPIPIPLIPGIEICQVFFEKAEGDAPAAESQFDGNRRPVLGEIRIDKVVEALRRRN
jgi:deoxycytidine triphosphate deaminase